MTDATSGAAGAALASANSAAEPGSGQSTTTQTTGSQASSTASTTESTWYTGAAPEHVGLLEKKGWNNPKGIDDLIKGYADIERAYRAGDKVVLPKDANDTEALANIYNRLGRPESPDKYVFPKEVDEATAKTFAPEFHKLGFNQQQVDALTKIDMERTQKAQEAFLSAARADSDAAMNKLNGEWGSKAPEQIEFAKRGFAGVGMSVQEFEKAHAVLGPGGAEKLMRLAALAGVSARESDAASMPDETRLGFGGSANGARMQLAEKRGDKAFMERVMKGDAAASAVMDRLYKQAYPEKA